MQGDPLIIERGLPVIKISGRGRPKGSGCNLRILAKMKSGDSLWDVSPQKMRSIKTSAARLKIKIKIRKMVLADGSPAKDYVFWKV